jgi:hypothetical protein
MNFPYLRPVNPMDIPKFNAMWRIANSMSILNALWWKFMPGEIITVMWPIGEVRIRQESSGLWDYVRSADPNDLYRPELEATIGKQGWDWDWRLMDKNIEANKLTIKFRKGKTNFASYYVMKWGSR